MAEYRTESNRLALVTGASKGLGLTLSRLLAAQGIDLIITARSPRQLQAAEKKLRSSGVNVSAVTGDVTDPTHLRHLADAVLETGGLDILVNNASTLGALPLSSLVDYPLDELRRVFEINTLAPLRLVQIMRPFLARRAGIVINISSDAATGGYEDWGGYGASKAALDLISLTLANELGEEAISVVSVDPGDMRTGMQQDAFPGQDISDRPLPEVTMPFWGWLFGQDPSEISGQRFQAQSELWEVAL